MTARQVLMLNRSDTEAALDIGEVLDRVAEALVAISRGDVSAPARIAARGPNGLLGAMPGYVTGMGLAAKLVSISTDDTRDAGTSHRGLVALFAPESGDLLAIINGAAITELRTAATATLSMQHLATSPQGPVAVIGTGAQARAQVRLLRAIGHRDPILIGSRDPAHRMRMSDVDASLTLTSIETACRNSTIIFCCTDAHHPVLQRSWLAEDVHVSSVGGSKGPELDKETLADGRIFVEWSGAVEEPPPAGAHELQGIGPDRVALLGAALDSTSDPTPTTPAMTIFKSTGHAALDVAAAVVTYASAVRHGIGTKLDFEG